MIDEVAEHKCYRDEGKEKILKNQRYEEFQRERNTSKVNFESKLLRIFKSSLDQLLNLPGKYFCMFLLLIREVSLILIAFAINLKWTSHTENCSHICWRQIIWAHTRIEVLFYIFKNIFILQGSFEHSIDFTLRHVLELLGHIHFLNSIECAKVRIFATSFVILIFSDTMCSKIWVVPDFVF